MNTKQEKIEKAKEFKKNLVAKLKEAKKQKIDKNVMQILKDANPSYTLNNLYLVYIQLFMQGLNIDNLKQIRPASVFFKENKRIKKGSKAIYIFAPCIKKTKKDENEDEDEEIKYFRLVPVFTNLQIEQN